jgi:heme/copper-type cytochrome/quinol oxidase subunit 2
MEMTQLIQQILDYLKNTGELLASNGYKIAYQQVINEARLALFFAILMFIVSLILLYFAYKYRKTIMDLDIYVPILIGTASLFLIFAFMIGTDSYLMFNNPDYYAIKTLIGLISIK